MGRLRVTGSLGPFRGDNWDSTKARSHRARPRPLGTQKGPGRGRAGDSRIRPSPTACTPLPGRGPALPRRAGRSRAPRAPHHPQRPVPRGVGGSSGARGPRLREEAFATIPGGGGGPGSGGRDGWRRRLGGRRRCRALPLPLSRPGPRPAAARSARPASSPVPGPAAGPYLAAAGSPPPLTLLIPGKLERAPGANPQTKSETSAAGREWLLVGALPLLPPHPLPAVSRAVP